jgi:outer membrane lipoprotein carrier protein
LHEPAAARVYFYVKLLAPAVCLLTAIFGAEVDSFRILKNVEDRYNNVRTLELDFDQTYSGPNRPRRTESGKLYLRKPGRMRWEYTKPAGKLFVSDGKNYWYYSPSTRRAEKMKLKEAEDMQAPLAFLLGRLDFSRDFSRFNVRQEGDRVRIAAEPKNPNKAPYREVEFLAAPDARIEELKVKGQDASVMEFRFRNEVRNPQQASELYTFTPPAGAEVVDP